MMHMVQLQEDRLQTQAMCKESYLSRGNRDDVD